MIVDSHSDLLYADALATRLMGGSSLFLPRRLVDILPDVSRKREGRETVALVYTLILNKQSKNQDKPVRIHSRQFEPLGSSAVTVKAKQILSEMGFIECSESYGGGYSSKRYKISDKSDLVEYELTKRSLFDLPAGSTHDNPACLITRDNLRNIEVDMTYAKQIFRDLLFEAKAPPVDALSLQNESQASFALERAYSTAADRYAYIPIPLHHLRSCSGSCIRASKGNRLFSPITCLKREFRRCISAGGEKLVEVDMICCQPTLIAHLAQDRRMISDCMADRFYCRFQDEYRISRDQAKEWFYSWNFGPNRCFRSNMKENAAHAFLIEKVMKTAYPDASAYVWQQKATQS